MEEQIVLADKLHTLLREELKEVIYGAEHYEKLQLQIALKNYLNRFA